MEYVEVTEERHEQCATVSKLVTVKLVRRKPKDSPGADGEIVGFDCSATSATCEKKCTYRMLLDDF